MKKINKTNIEDILALTPMQAGMLFHYLKNPESNHYFEQLSLEISGEIDLEFFEKAWNFVIETNEMVRTVFRWEKVESPIQIILKEHKIALKYYEFQGEGSEEEKKWLEEIKVRDRKETFDLHKVPFRVILCKAAEDKYEMIISNHHILYDGWSNGIILNEFFTVYNNLVHKKKIQKPIKSKFKEFVKWLNTQDKKEQEKFWKEYLKGVETETELPVKIKQTRGKQISSWSNSRISIHINKDNREKLEKFIHHRKITMAAFMYCTWGILLHKYINTRDVIFGTTVSGRSAKIKDIENITGLFINTIPLRLRIGDGQKTKDMLYYINEILTIREKYESTSLVDIKRYGQVENNSELFDSIVVLENYPLDRGLMRENSKKSPMSLLVDSYSINEATTYDLTVGITIGEDIAINFSFPEELFEKAVIRRLSRHFIHIMESILKDDERDIPALEILSEKEKKQLLVDFNAAVEEYPKDKTIHELFARQVDRTPNNIALIFGFKELTYRELNKNSDSLAYLLREKGVGPGTIVGMMVERSLEMIIGLMGILKAGGAYLPIDPDYPQERIDYMLKDSGAKILLTGQEIAGLYSPKALNNCPKGTNSINNYQLTINNLQLEQASLAYIIYTSGSTGKPKGVLIEHFAAVNLAFSQVNRFGISTRDRVLQFSSICFDASVEQIFIALFSGAVLVLIDKNTLLEPGKFEAFISSRSITHLHAVPSFLSNMELTGHYHLKRIIAGGDVCPPALAKKWSKYCDFYNEYGPTETTVTSIEILVKNVDETSIGLPIGRPINNTFLYLFDKWMKLVPLGAIGELYIGGEGVARGYLNRPELTAEKFVELEVQEDIYHRSDRTHKSHIIYKTGDLARWLPDGNMEFLGRIDHQVKIRGFRIEPGEIENQLLTYKEVKEAVVTVKKDKAGGDFLCAYIVSRSIPGFKISRLKDYLKQKLPGYMIPPYFVILEKIPLTPTGKIDRKSLPEPDITTAAAYSPPRNEREKRLVNIWANLLEIDKTKIGMNDNFFELGGHSLKATLLMARIHKQLDTEIPLSQLFRFPTIRGLARCIDKAEKSRYLSIEPEEEKEYYVLSSAQKRIYFLEQMDAATLAYNIPAIFQLEGALDRDRLEETFVKLVQRHESLRTSFRMMEEEPVQLIHGDVKFEIKYYDLPVTGAGDRYKWEEDLASDFIRPFDLSQAPLLRAGLVKLPHTPTAPGGHRHFSQEGIEDKHLLMVDMHHIISDGMSADVLIHDFTGIYQGKELPKISLRYKDYAQWQERQKGSDHLLKQKEYWRKEFDGEIPVLELPTDYARPAIQQYEGSSVNFTINKETTEKLKALAVETGATLYMVLLALYSTFLSKISSREQVVIGTPVAGRRHADLEKIIGMFVNTLALRICPSGEKKFTDFLEEVKEKTLNAFENQDYQYEDLVEEVSVTRDASRNPLFDTMFVLQNTGIQSLDIPALKVVPNEYATGTSKFDLTLRGKELEEKLVFTFEYSTNLFKDRTIERFIAYFTNLVQRVLENKHREIPGIEIIPEAERNLVLYEFNSTGVEFPRDKTLHQLFEEQVKKTPDRIALNGLSVSVEAIDKLPLQITYRELNKKSNLLAHVLKQKGIQPDTITTIMVERSIEMIFGILGILKAGGAYLPIEPDYPQERIDFILKDSGARVLVDEDLLMKIAQFTPPVQPTPPTQLTQITQSHNLAYVIYTSGSTGRPKGVLVEHFPVVNLVFSQVNRFGINTKDRVLQFSSICFDASVEQIFIALFSGAVLVLIDKNTLLEAGKFETFISGRSITHLHAVPSFLSNMGLTNHYHLKRILSGGDVCPVALAKKWSKYCDFYNRYGPTETTVTSIEILVKNIDERSNGLPIGKPINNTFVYLFDKWMKPVPIGTIGELYIGGEGVARGYLNKPELTAEKFYQDLSDYQDYHEEKNKKVKGKNHENHMRSCNHASMQHHFPSPQYPIPPLPHSPIYRTGDLARWLPDGNMEFLGRIDHQVKIRGFRIEPGEIENQLLNYKEVKEAVVTVKKDKTGDRFLCVYIVSHSTPGVEISRLKDYLKQKLPGYMIPPYFVMLEKIPLTPTGKIDRKSLPEPDITTAVEYSPPGNEREKRLVNIWANLLEMDKTKIGMNDNFFELGGHSLKATLLMARIHKEFDTEIPLSQLFRSPTIRGLTRCMDKAEESRYLSIEPEEEKEYYVLSSAQKRIYLLEQMDAATSAYNIPAIFQLEGALDRDRLEETFVKLVQRHESLRTSFRMMKEEPVQLIHDDVKFEIEYYDLQVTGAGDRCKWEEDLSFEFIRPFDLSQAPLLRARLVKLPHTPTAPGGHRHFSQEGIEGKYLLMVDMHHIISDGMSTDVLIHDFTGIYQGKELAKISLRYKDYAQWQERQKGSDHLLKQKEYWKKEFDGEIPVLELPTDYARPAIQQYEGRSVNFTINKETTIKLKALAAETGATLYMVLLALYSTFLSKISSQEQIVIGTPVAGRGHADLEKIIGMFVNTLALRIYPSGEKKFTDFLEEVKEKTLNAFENQDYQYEDLVEDVSLTRNASRNPLFDTMFVLQNTGIQSLDIPALKVVPYEYATGTSKFDLTLMGMEVEEKLVFTFEYSTNLFKDRTIERFITYFTNLVQRVLENKHRELPGIEIIPEAERNLILYDFNSTGVEFPGDKTIHQSFEEQVKKTPDHMAIVGPSLSVGTIAGAINQSPLHQITYKKLNENANQLAHDLIQKGIQPDKITTIMVERSIEMVVAIFGILKAGGAYLPIDPNYPPERIDFMLKDSKAAILLTSSDFSNFQWSTGFEKQPAARGSQPPASLAYIIYTSGSTGKPKGVLVDHTSALNTLFAMQEKYPHLESDVYLLKTPYIFDVSVTELFGWFWEGGRLAVLEKNGEKNPALILDAVEGYKVTHINFVPSLFNVFTDHLNQGNIEKLSSLKYLFLAGEALLPELVKKFRTLDRAIILENLYGPTEAAVYASGYSLSQWEGKGSVPIGRPLPNVLLYILDKNNLPQPLGVSGELCIGGAGLARGYLNRPELTAERFFTVFYRSYKSYMSYIYRTGDLAQWLPDGHIEYLGRIDYQIKIRGFRVELGEIESRLLSHVDIKEAVLSLKTSGDGDGYLCAYIVTKKEGIPALELRRYLSQWLPDYMIPTYFEKIEEIPLTSTGKINRNALPEPKIISTAEYISPRNTTEERFAEIWSQVLGIEKEKIGIDDNFFQLGGHSLKAAILISRIEEAFNVKIPLGEIFKSPKIRALCQYINDTEKEKYLRIEKTDEREYYPLSSAQKRLYFLQQMNKNGTTYNIPSAWILEGVVEKDNLEQSIRELIRRHESLRTSFKIVEEEPMQIIHNEADFDIEYYDSTTISSFIRPFDLSRAPLLRVGLVKLPHTPAALDGHRHFSQEGREDKHLLMVDMHHIISDGISSLVLIEDFIALYAGEELPGPKLRYKDYIRWLDRKKEGTYCRDLEEYWKKEFQGEVPVLALPTDFSRPLVQSFEGNRKSFEMGIEIYSALKDLALETGATLYMVLLAAYFVFLSKISSQEDIVIGTPTAGRPHADLEKIIGMFVNTLALRNYPSGEKKFIDFLIEVKEKTIGAFENQEYQYEDLVEQVPVNRDVSRNPLFDTMFILQNTGLHTLEIPGLKVIPYQYETQTSKFDLTLTGVEAEEKLLFTVEYSIKLFKQETIHRLIAYFKNILKGVIKNKEQRISQLEIMPGEEKNRILYEFNNTAAEFPGDKTIRQLFEEQVERTPDKIAIVGSLQMKYRSYRTYMTYISYRQLNEKSNQLAHWLGQRNVESNTIVGIMIERSLEMIIGIFGILKAGGAYLPIAPGSPAERVKYILADSGTHTLVTADTLAEVVDGGHSPGERDTHHPGKGQTVSGSRANLAYVLYTSGSTGHPKGVMVENPSVINLLFALHHQYPLKKQDTYLLKTSYLFDVSVTELFGWFLEGGRAAILEQGGEKDPEKIVETIEWAGVTHINFVPSMFNAFVQVLTPGNMKRLSGLKYIFLAGEALLPELVNKFRSLQTAGVLIPLENIYGPTEATVYSSGYSLANWDGTGRIPIGKPLANMTLFILDKNNRLQPTGIPGELCISGLGLARGYLNRPELTAEKFDRDLWDYLDYHDKEAPFGQIINASGEKKLAAKTRQDTRSERQTTGEKQKLGDRRWKIDDISFFRRRRLKSVRRTQISLTINNSQLTINNSSLPPTPFPHSPIYHTGDLTRWLSDGNIEYLGRMDHQVKIRGFRIELGEIENRLMEHKNVKEAVLLLREDETGDQYLCAYVVCVDSSPDKNTPTITKELKDYLSQALPEYMIPSYISLLAEMPLNRNGKIDRKALPEPEFSVSSEEYIAPGNAIEKKLAEMWKKLLKVEKIGIHDSFFDIGGHSLKALQLVNAIKKEFNKTVNINDIFLFPTIARMYELIGCREKTEEQEIELQPEKEHYELSYSQKRMWLLIQLDPDSPTFNLPVRLTLHDRVDESIIQKVLETLVERHESLRTYIKITAGNPVQIILHYIPVKMERVDISHLDEKRRKEMRNQLSRQESIEVLKLENPPLFRFKLVKYSDTESDLLMTIHHIISDGWSMEILENEFNLLYETYKNAGSANLEPLRIRYRDYVNWHNGLVSDEERMKSAKDFWESQLRGKNTVLDLPYDYPMPSTKIKDSAGYRCVVPGEIVDQLRKIANQQQASLFMVLLAGFNIVLSQVTGQEDILVGVPGAARQHEDLKNIVGFFVNTLVLIERVNPEEPFLDFLSRVQTKTFQVLEYQSYPLEMICSEYKIPYPEVSVFFNMLKFGDITNKMLTDDACGHLEKVQDAKFDMVCYLREYKNGIEIETHYYKMLFDPFTIEKVMQMYLTVLERIAMNPGMDVSEYSAARKKKLNITSSAFEIECNEANERYDLIGLR